MWKPQSLVGRVALSVHVGSLVAGTIVALVTGVLSDRLAQVQEDRHLRDEAGTLAFELQVKGYDPVYAATDETEELAHTGIVVAIFGQGRFVAGHSALAFVAPGTCVDAGSMRACAVSAGRWVAIAARDRSLTRDYRALSARAALIAVLLTSLLSAGAAFALAYAAVKPLDRLASAVQRVPADARGVVELGDHEGFDEVDALRAALRSTFEQLRQALGHARNFAGNAAHQLRTPLATIIGELDLALEAGDEQGRLETIRARLAALRLSTLIDRLLILAGPDDAVQGSTEVALLDVVEDALETLPESARQRVAYEGAYVTLRADPALLVSAIVSALENSLKLSLGTVRVYVEAHGDVALLAVQDDGPGVTALVREQLSAPLYRARQARAGHGIGLAVIARVTALHGGSAHFVEGATGARLEMTFARADD